MTRWFRWYQGTTEDGKFRVAARNARVTVRDVIALWAFVLEDAANDKHRGICERNEDFIAAILDFDAGVCTRILVAMQDLGMISVGAGAITVCNWNVRQYETDQKDSTNAERQKRYRERHKNDAVTPVTDDRNGTVTATKLPETESDTETEKKDSRARARETVEEVVKLFDEFLAEYPGRKGGNPKAPALKAFSRTVIAKGDLDRDLAAAIIGGAKRFAAECRELGKVGTEFVPMAVTWLNQKRWGDYPEKPDVPTIAVPPGKFYAPPESPQLDAWHRHMLATRGRGLPRDKAGGWLVDSEWPPGCGPAVQKPSTAATDSLGSAIA